MIISLEVEVAPYWNVNGFYFLAEVEDDDCRSSSILECKLEQERDPTSIIPSRSSSILECKSTFYFSITFYFFVEVAPYWNVNVSTPEAIIACISVEVAPYWNVNLRRTI